MRKKAPVKVPVSKQVWQWAENVKPEDITDNDIRTAYRLNLGKCKSCRKNCVGNPNCLRGLGEGSWFAGGNHQSLLETTIFEINKSFRQEGEFVGLPNLGATCYVNTFLQLWFHNHGFRKAVYQFKEPTADRLEQPHTVCGHLQLIFALLHKSKRRNIDPTEFIKCLGLDTGLQQDAQEFSKLLISLLESTSSVGDLIRAEFSGQYDYHTKCHTCGFVSKRPSRFYELDLSIQGHKDVSQCLTEFFEEEQLKSENQYHCNSCDCKRDASRRIIVRSLPRTLNLQLLRFVFDKSTWKKKKLSTCVSFPEILDMSPFVNLENVSPEEVLYELTAVLIHRGPSASSGHYIAHIKDSTTQLWYRFNDEEIVQMKSGKTLDLDAVTDKDFESDLVPKPSKKPRLKKNSHSSKNAYMLVYTKKTESGGQLAKEVPAIPSKVLELVDEDNKKFELTLNTVILEEQKKTKEAIEKYIKTARFIKSLYDTEGSAKESFCWVPTTWLKQMLDQSTAIKKPFTSDKLLCSHKNLDPDRAGMMKCIPEPVAQFFYSMCDEENPLISESSLCRKCVEDQCFSIHFKIQLKKDHDTVTRLLKSHDCDKDGSYYIGKSTLRYWKSMALKNIVKDKPNESSNADNGMKSGSEDENCEVNEDMRTFNENLLCEHGNLTTELSEIRTVSIDVWNIIMKYFPGVHAYKVEEYQPCNVCQMEEEDEVEMANIMKTLKQEQKSKLQNLFANKNRPTHQDLFDVDDNIDHSFYVLSSKFVSDWRQSMRSAVKVNALSEIKNKILFCPHDKLLCDPSVSCMNISDGDAMAPTAVLVWPYEWEYIRTNFIVDKPIVVTKQTVECGIVTNETGNICGLKKSLDLESDYRTLSEKDVRENPGVHENQNSNNEFSKHSEIEEVKANILSDKSLKPQTPGKKKRKANLIYEPPVCSECIASIALERENSLRNYIDADIYIRKVIPDDNGNSTLDTQRMEQNAPRRSKRTHTTRGEKKLTVSSDWTLKQLKIKLMSLFSIPPFDQNIWLDSKSLTDDEATLGMLSVFPGCTLLVLADEPDANALENFEVHDVSDKRKSFEAGFKGTGLLSI